MGEMNYIAVADTEARAETEEYTVACSILTAVDQCGFRADGENFAARCEQRKELLGRLVVILADYRGRHQ